MDAYSAGSDSSPDRGREWLRIDTIPAPDGVTIRLSVAGELDRLAASQLAEAVKDSLQRSSPTTMEIDISGVTFLDSGGIRCLLICRRHARTAGCAFLLLNPAPMVSQVLRITGLLETFGLPAQYEGPTRWVRQTAP